jgi:high-affinity iron transporter
MYAQFLITFREALEVSLIVSILMAYLVRTGKSSYTRYIWYGLFIAVVMSILFGITIWLIYGGLSEANTKLFEGVAAIIAVVVLTSMIIWMAFKGRYLKQELQTRVEVAVAKGTAVALIGLAFLLVFREGFETVLFLTPFSIGDGFGTMAGASAGIVFSLIFAYIFFKIGMNINLSRFFYFSSILLIFLAAGLLGYGIHELIEYREAAGLSIGWYGEIAYDLGIAKDSIFYHKGAVGSIAAVMFGYSAKMEVGRVFGHILYLAMFLPLTILAYKKPELFDSFTKLWKSFKKVDLDQNNFGNKNNGS